MSLANRIILHLALLMPGIASAQTFTISGIVSDKETGEALPFASVAETGSHGNGVLTDTDGRYTIRLTGHRNAITIKYVGYTSVAMSVADTAKIVNIAMMRSNALKEVVVTARENSGPTSISRIDRSAMEHLQPTSFTDILELLPGNMSQTPDMGSANTITLRETGTVTATGARISTSGNYAITSLGTLFVVDGTPVNTDGNMQSLPGGSESVDQERDVTNRGVDMRSISTDNIESVEVVRGIPSAEYGNLTSGMVNIRRIRRATPFSARFKADEYSKLFSVGKGFAIGGEENVLNIDAGYLDSKVDPRNNQENYKRVNASARLNAHRVCNAVDIRWNVGADYTGSFDNSKVDPDLNYNRINDYKSTYNRTSFNSELRLTLPDTRWFNALTVNTSASYQHDKLERHRQVSPQRTSIAPTTMEEGVHDGRYLTGEYIADLTVDGRPFNLFLKGMARGLRNTGQWTHAYKIGVEWTLTKNFGHGQVYDLSRPLSASWPTRPRSFSSIPSLKILSTYLEDNITANFGNFTLELQAGLRTSQITGLDKRYRLSGRIHLDPRVNVVLNLPSFSLGSYPVKIHIGGGYGLTTKLPTADYLFPQVYYSDFIQLSYYDVYNPREHSRVNLRTYIDDPTNYNLRAARNHKWELRTGAEWNGNTIGVTYFRENLNSGYRYSAIYTPRSFRRYDASAIDGTLLTTPPELDGLPFEDRTVLDGYSRVTNGSRIRKEGIEFQISTRRWDALRTSLTISGAWFHTTYANSQKLFRAVSQVVGNEAVSDHYVGLYNTNDGRVNDQLNTNFMFDTQIIRWGLIFTTNIQCMWWVRTRQMRQSGTPESYMATDGLLHPFTEADLSDPMLRQLVINYSDAQFQTLHIRPAIYINLKATKQIGRWLRISAYVNRILDYLPSYTNNGLTIRRTSSPYFGMEATITI